MILVVANLTDETAQDLVQLFPKGAASLFTAQSLSHSGLATYTNQFADSFITINEIKIPFSSITGVITLIPVFFDWELIQIQKEDRGYIASEMNAFMTYFLTRLCCPKLNSPSASYLSGHNWRREHWIKIASHLQIPVQPFTYDSKKNKVSYLSDVNIITITVIGNQHFGTSNEILIQYAFQLAKYTKLELLQVTFIENDKGDTSFFSASQFPDLESNLMQRAIVNYFKSHS